MRLVWGLLALLAVGPAWAQNAIALVGKPALPADFTHFPYANPDAPKGGTMVMGASGSFDSFNPFIVQGVPPEGIMGLFDTLLVPSADEPATEYAHLAKTIEIAPDHSWVAFDLRPEAKFHDGTPVTAEDVVWSFNTLRTKGAPQYRTYWADVASVEATSASRVVFHFKNVNNPELPQIVGELPVLPEHWWKGRDFSQPLHEAPLGSGPYVIKSFDTGRSITYARAADWWAADLPTGRGLHNFDLNIQYFLDPIVEFEAFKSGQIDFYQEVSSKNWATAYDFPALEKGLVKREVVPHQLPTGMQEFGMNTRRALFADRRVRQALTLAYDFEWADKNLFYGYYTRTLSYFSNSQFASSGLPSADELKLLEPFRAELPPEVFTTPFTLPVTDGSGNNRPELRQALGLLKQAGWMVKDGKLVDAAGDPFVFQITVDNPAFDRVVQPYIQNLARLGITATERLVDPAQYERITDNFDFDMIIATYPESEYPGHEQSYFWGCAAGKMPGGSNLSGICDPAVDALAADVGNAQNTEQLLAATHALDRVLLWGWYGVPNWHLQNYWIAYWNKFSRVPGPLHSGFDLDAWWIDPAKDAALAKAKQAN